MKHFQFTILIFFCLLLIGYSYFVEPNIIEINRYVVNCPDIKGLKIVFASDFHIKPYDRKRLNKIVKYINAENPDLVLSTGDFVCSNKKYSTMSIEDIAKGLSKVRTKYGFYTTLGNHDGWYSSDKITTSLINNGIQVLSNKNILIDINGQKIYIAGIEDKKTGKPDIHTALKGIEINHNGEYKYPIIMLTHTPDMFPEITTNITLTLAGHTHGGQIRIPFLGAIYTASIYGKKYASGWVQEKGNKSIHINNSKLIQLNKYINTLFVTRGIGASILPLRFNCPPEINVIKFK